MPDPLDFRNAQKKETHAMAQYPKVVVAAESIINDNSYLDDAENYTVCVYAAELTPLMDAVNILVDAGWYVNGGITVGPHAPQSYLIVLSYEADEE
jgi:hypothetical protein